ncbi:inositol 1,4,5-trisphosphate receptor-interacting protein-like 1 [Corvus kubaryi]|uniref:inositol 1,4,5-trisphosphate receptor-interacting protein-like 1 n=1 Tax=Corvus kubaryi TaxID=68294 RepID=UPI001C04EE28|nr:inositol 1,4,5-trisphosphate receptor-interacting protein-like 1 [Corvus kubaryi]
MAAFMFLVLLVHSLLQYPQMVGDGLDEDTRLLMELRAKYEELQRIRLLQELQELEQATLEQSGGPWGAMLWAALQQWPFWAVAAVLALLLVLCFVPRKRCCEPESSGQETKSSSNVDKRANDKENNALAKKEGEITLANVEKDNNADDSGEGGSNAGTTGKDNVGSEGIEGSEDAKAGKGNDDVNVEEDKKHDGNEEEDSNAVTNERDNVENEAEEGTEEAKAGEGGDDVNVEEDTKEAGKEAESSNAVSNEKDNAGNEEKEGNEDGDTGKVKDDENVIKDNTEARNEEEGGNVDTNEEDKEARHGGKKFSKGTNEEEVNANTDVQKNNTAGNEGEKSDTNEDKEWDFAGKLERLVQEHMQWPLVDLDRGCATVTLLMDNFTRAFGYGSSNHFYPVLQQAIGVGNAFEGWRPCAEGALYHVLVPLSAPPGHAFHLEPDTGVKMPGRNFRVRVDLECTCVREQLGDNAMLCFLHHSKEELSRKQEPSLLDTLCTGPYLDVEKTACWLYRLVRADWLLLPQSSHRLNLMLLPSSRSCKMQLSKGKESLVVEVLFGVRQGDSDIYVSSQPTEVHFMPSTTWHETYAVAEANFFRHVARRAPQDSWHCKCLQFLTGVAMGKGFSAYALKTVVMHLLNTRPLSQWSRRDFMKRLVDIVDSLRCSLDKKRLDHFVIGNQRLPGEISLPPELQRVEPPNLFQHLACDPDAYREVVQEYIRLRHQLKQLLLAAVKASAKRQR